MNVWMISPEMAPYSKVGGLGDVAGALPAALCKLGVKTSVFAPYLPDMAGGGWKITDTGVRVSAPSWGSEPESRVLEVSTGNGVGVFLIDSPLHFHREGLYGTPHGDHWDNAQRFAYFTRAAIEAGRKLAPAPGVVHAHDWPTGLAPFLVRAPEHYGALPEFADTATVQSIHNLSHQGRFQKELLPELGISWHRFNHLELEFWDSVNFLKAGLVFSDAIVAVSPTYAREIQTPEHGWGLDGVLRERADRLHGIVNGIDTDAFDPATDKALASTFAANRLAGRAKNKAQLRGIMGLPESDKPVVGAVTRFVFQKGIDILLDLAPRIESLGVQFALLGTGEKRYEDALTHLAMTMPETVAVKIGFSDEIARIVYGGSDFFFMPSLFEPCGLGQLIALRYGAVPIVRRTGGLNDTVTDFGAEDGVGVVFDHPTADDAAHALWRATELYKDADRFVGTRKRGMGRDNSWKHSAREYAALYESLAGARKGE